MITTTKELVLRGMAAADMHDAAVTPAQWNFWMTQENVALSLFLARSGWTLNAKTATITVAGTEAGDFILSATPLAIVAIHEIGPQGVRPVHLNNAVDFLRQLPGSTRRTGHPDEYRVLWDQDTDQVTLNFYPEPTAGMQFLITYVPFPLKLTLDNPVSDSTVYANTVSYPMGWEERIALGLARRALGKEESDTGEIREQIRECEGMIEEAVYDKVLAESPTVRNADRDRRGWGDKLLYPSPQAWWWPL